MNLEHHVTQHQRKEAPVICPLYFPLPFPALLASQPFPVPSKRSTDWFSLKGTVRLFYLVLKLFMYLVFSN